MQKKMNEYAAAYGPLYETTPKSVFAAVALSFALRLNDDDFAAALVAVGNEWRELEIAGIIPQHAAGYAAALVRAAGEEVRP